MTQPRRPGGADDLACDVPPPLPSILTPCRSGRARGVPRLCPLHPPALPPRLTPTSPCVPPPCRSGGARGVPRLCPLHPPALALESPGGVRGPHRPGGAGPGTPVRWAGWSEEASSPRAACHHQECSPAPVMASPCGRIIPLALPSPQTFPIPTPHLAQARPLHSPTPLFMNLSNSYPPSFLHPLSSLFPIRPSTRTQQAPWAASWTSRWREAASCCAPRPAALRRACPSTGCPPPWWQRAGWPCTTTHAACGNTRCL